MFESLRESRYSKWDKKSNQIPLKRYKTGDTRRHWSGWIQKKLPNGRWKNVKRWRKMSDDERKRAAFKRRNTPAAHKKEMLRLYGHL